jgi:putative endonuclease
MSFFVYVLKSRKDGRSYIGSSQNVAERVRRHNAGDCHFTKGHRPWGLIYKESVKTRSEVVKRERFFKSGAGRKLLQEIISSK